MALKVHPALLWQCRALGLTQLRFLLREVGGRFLDSLLLEGFEGALAEEGLDQGFWVPTFSLWLLSFNK